MWNPGAFQPYQAQPFGNAGVYQPQAQQGAQLIRVTGIEGAKAYQMGPNSVVPLFDANDDVMRVIGEHMEAIRTVAPREYDAVVSRLRSLHDAHQAQD